MASGTLALRRYEAGRPPSSARGGQLRVGRKAYAEHLVVSPATSKTYVSRILTKLGARDRAQLVAIAYETGLVSPGAR